MAKLFVYGSLMNDEVLRALLHRRLAQQQATLNDYRRVKVMGEQYPAIYPDTNSLVEGKLITHILPKQLACLDEFEGSYYQRAPVVVFTEDNKEHKCDAYIFKNEYRHLLSDDDWCNTHFRTHHMASFLKYC